MVSWKSKTCEPFVSSAPSKVPQGLLARHGNNGQSGDFVETLRVDHLCFLGGSFFQAVRHDATSTFRLFMYTAQP